MRIDEHVSRGDDASTAGFDWGEITWLDGDDRTAGTGLTVGHVTFRPGESNAAHRHPGCEEALYLLSGELEHWIGEERTVLEPGDLLHIPRNEPHSATNLADEEAAAVIVYDTDDRQVELVDEE